MTESADISRCIALIDSGVRLDHPHIRPLPGASLRVLLGPVIGAPDSPQCDQLGHGTAVAAAILDLAPAARILSIQLFRDRPTSAFPHVLEALHAALAADVSLINLSLGTTDPSHADALSEIVSQCVARSIRLIAPADSGGLASYPGVLPGVDGVYADPSLDRAAPIRRPHQGRPFWFASPFPRSLPGLDRSRNLSGVSFAVANVTAFLAQ